MCRVQSATRQDRAAWRKMRSALWPGSDPDHAREIDAYFEGRLSNPLEVLLAFDPTPSSTTKRAEVAHLALGFEETVQIRCFRKELDWSSDV